MGDPNDEVAANKELKVGEKFRDEDEAKDFIKNFSKANFCDFNVGTNNAKQLLFHCKHSRFRKHKGTGNRPQQHYNYMDCHAKIWFYKSQKRSDRSLKITQIDLDHTHPLSEEIYNH